MSIKVIEVLTVSCRYIWLIDPGKVIEHEFTWRQVPGVEADDVIGTLAVRSVDAGYKVIFWSYSGETFSFLKSKIFEKHGRMSLVHDWFFNSCDWIDKSEIYNLLREISFDQDSNYQFDFGLGIHLQEAKSDALMVTVASSKHKLKSCIVKYKNSRTDCLVFLSLLTFFYWNLSIIINVYIYLLNSWVLAC